VGENEQLPERARRWVLSRVAKGGSVTSTRRLTGGLTAETHAVDVERPGETPLCLVLKRYPELNRRSCVGVEAAALGALEGVPLSFAVPSLVAADESGRECDVPALLALRVPGCISLELTDWADKVSQAAEALAELHAACLPCPPMLADYSIAGMTQRQERIPEGIPLPDWASVWRFVEGGVWGGSKLIHADYHLGNTLFADGRLSGVVDWASARRGAHELDVGYCRLDLSMLLGGSAPELFLAAYERKLGQRVPNVSAWDLAASVRAFPDPLKWLAGWLDAGRTDLTPELIRARLVDFVQNALSRG
jgi:aminoglycoside phosphotransferase (APT) family kinase protein